ncbi:MAG: hypothetical protein Ta2B_28830 [Termitinemataceae bacterium]|nr:MAG: hypothetical protein Ta2B_28830 [Termitinemataceae bacterium]
MKKIKMVLFMLAALTFVFTSCQEFLDDAEPDYEWETPTVSLTAGSWGKVGGLTNPDGGAVRPCITLEAGSTYVVLYNGTDWFYPKADADDVVTLVDASFDGSIDVAKNLSAGIEGYTIDSTATHYFDITDIADGEYDVFIVNPEDEQATIKFDTILTQDPTDSISRIDENATVIYTAVVDDGAANAVDFEPDASIKVAGRLIVNPTNSLTIAVTNGITIEGSGSIVLKGHKTPDSEAKLILTGDDDHPAYLDGLKDCSPESVNLPTTLDGTDGTDANALANVYARNKTSVEAGGTGEDVTFKGGTKDEDTVIDSQTTVKTNSLP